MRLASVLVTMLVLFSVDGACGVPPAERPNILLILVDDLGYADVGFHGSKDIPTPNLDHLASEGVRFTNGYVSHSFCSPSRAGLLTGRYQQRFGHEFNPRFGRDHGLPLGEILLPQVLKKAGYTSAIIGKWHLGDAPRFHPLRRGFGEFFGFVGGGHNFMNIPAAELEDFPYGPKEHEREEYAIPLHRNYDEIAVNDYLTDAFSREAAEFLERNRSDPFFLYLSYNAPHIPLQAPQRYIDRVASIPDRQRRMCAAMMAAVDDGVGLVMAKLRELDLDGRTLVFFLSDNGGPPWANAASNAPLRGTKGTVYEGGIRVPFVARWTGRLAAGSTYDNPVIALDIYATAAALAGSPSPSDRTIDGVNLLPYLLGEAEGVPHGVLYWRSGAGQQFAIRAGENKLVKYRDEAPALYNLSSDTGETTDLASQQAVRFDDLSSRYDRLDRQMVQPLWGVPAHR